MNNDISNMSREELVESLSGIQQLLISIGEKIREISTIEKSLEEERKRASSEGAKLSKEISIIFYFALIVFEGLILIMNNATFLGVVLLMIICWVVLRVIFAIIDSIFFADESATKEKDYYTRHVIPLEKELDAANMALEDILIDKKTTWAIDTLQEKYFDLNAVTCFLNYITYRRADSYKEAVNLYEEELHRLKMEELQQSILENAEKTARITEENVQTLKNVEVSAASATRAAKIGAVINYATYSNIKAMRK